MPAPPFLLPDQDGMTRSLADYAGKRVLLYVYPKDDTPGCTKEACGLRDAMKAYDEAGCVVLGLSADSPKRHRAFADKYGLPFTLLSDPDKGVIRAYGALGEKSFMGKTFIGIKRMSFLIGPDGSIEKVYPDVSPETHAAEVLSDITG